MCADPVSLISTLGSVFGGGAAAGAAGAAAGSTLLGTIATVATIGGGIMKARAQARNYQAQAEAAERTAVATEKVARQTVEQGDQESDRRRAAGRALRSENTAALAANGIDVGSSHALDILDDTSLLVEEDAFAIRESARYEADGRYTQAENARADAASARSSARFAPIQTILGTASSVGEKYASWIPDREVQTAGAY